MNVLLIRADSFFQSAAFKLGRFPNDNSLVSYVSGVENGIRTVVCDPGHSGLLHPGGGIGLPYTFADRRVLIGEWVKNSQALLFDDLSTSRFISSPVFSDEVFEHRI